MANINFLFFFFIIVYVFALEFNTTSVDDCFWFFHRFWNSLNIVSFPTVTSQTPHNQCYWHWEQLQRRTVTQHFPEQGHTMLCSVWICFSPHVRLTQFTPPMPWHLSNICYQLTEKPLITHRQLVTCVVQTDLLMVDLFILFDNTIMVTETGHTVKHFLRLIPRKSSHPLSCADFTKNSSNCNFGRLLWFVLGFSCSVFYCTSSMESGQEGFTFSSHKWELCDCILNFM